MVAKVIEAKDTVLSDEQFLEWCGLHFVKGCGGTRTMEGADREVSRCEDCRALAQAEATFVAGQRAERVRIHRMAIGGSEKMGSSNYWVKFKKSDWEDLVRKCSRCHRVREDDLESDICGSCADDLRGYSLEEQEGE